MAEVLVSALLPVIFEKLTSEALKRIARYKGIDAEIKKWQRSLTQFQDVLADASQKEITNRSVTRWLNDLQHLAYDIDDVLDDLATDVMDREAEPISITSKVRKLIPTCCTKLPRRTKMIHKLDGINTKLQELLEEKATLGLIRVDGETRPRNNNGRFQSPVFDPYNIVGRQDEIQEYVRQLLGEGPCDQSFIVPIVGMGGVGKTTLAKLLYDDNRVRDHFILKAWVCVSDDFDIPAISKVIYQYVTGVNKEFAALNLLQEDLVGHLRGKRFLLVLDDVWTESYDEWEKLVAPFHACAPGSKIIITTRKDQLLKKLGCDNLKKLEELSTEDALSSIALHALGVNNFDSHLVLKPHALGIVKKCGHLPLALKALGRLLRTKKVEECFWKDVLESEIWASKDYEVLPALKLSYNDLSARLKQLFAYCSLFPKDFMFDKEQLVLLWMGEGFLHQSPPRDSNSSEESMGGIYFDELLSRSFFQEAPNNISLFVMHDKMNDLATYVASEFFVRLDTEAKKDTGSEMLEKCHHLSFACEQYVTYKKFETFKTTNSLRTFLATSVPVVESWRHFYLSNKIMVDLLPRSPLLRVLCLNNFEISEVPESIGTLRHLRYLNLSRTAITHLPKNVYNLYHLETLIVCGCRCFAEQLLKA